MPRVVHFEINADDVERAVQFYSDVFGWKAEKWAGPMEYWLIMTGEGDTRTPIYFQVGGTVLNLILDPQMSFDPYHRIDRDATRAGLDWLGLFEDGQKDFL